MIPIGTPLKQVFPDASPELIEADEIVNSGDRSSAAEQRLSELYDAASSEDKVKISLLTEAFAASQD